MDQRQTAWGLGIFSIGLGVTEVLAPNWVSRLAGMEKSPAMVRAFGMREIGTGMAILSQSQSPTWMWARVGGDVLDLAALAGNGQRWGRVALAGAAILGIAVVDVAAAQRLSVDQREADSADQSVVAQRSTIIHRPAGEIAKTWKRPETMQSVMAGVGEISIGQNGRTHWRLSGPLGTHFEFDTEIVEERPGEIVRWRSINADDGALSAEGEISFLPESAGRGTVVQLKLSFAPPPGLRGGVVAMAKPFTDAAAGVALDRFKSLIETGEVATSRSQPELNAAMVGEAASSDLSAAHA